MKFIQTFLVFFRREKSLKWSVITLIFTVALASFTYKSNESPFQVEVDVCVYGGSSAGLIAAYTAKKLGKSVIVIEPGNYLGGLTAGGLGATDIGNKYAITGLGKDFYRRIGEYYNKFEQWTFEPHVADKVFADYIKEAQLDVKKNFRLVSVEKEGEWIKKITIEDSNKPDKKTNRVIKAKMFIDATYEGDLMAKSGVSYTVGRESNAQYGETFNGVQFSDFHQFPDNIDPYKIPGDPRSGLLWGISSDKLMPQGSADNKVQAYNFRLALTQDKNNQIAFAKPENYDPSRYELLLRVIEKEKWTTIHSSFTVDKLPNGGIYVNHSGGFLIKNMPNGKTDFNNFGGFSTDMIGANHNYPDGDYDTRKKIWKEHEDYTKGLLYFLSHDDRVPAHIREEMGSWGFSKDEFVDLNGFSSQLYVREARRMVADVVMTQLHSEGKEVVEDQIGMAAYQMDSHNIQRIVVNGMVKNEGDVQKAVPAPFPISYRSIVPKASQVKNLLVPVCLSASHIAFGSIRMEPVFMVLGQSAATAAVMAINSNKAVQEVNIAALQEELKNNPLANGSLPEILVDNDDQEAVIIDGNWERRRGGYGPNHLYDSNPQEIKTVKFIPTVAKEGEYEIFTYLAKNSSRSNNTGYVIHNGRETKEVVVDNSSIEELGLSSGEWVSLGKYNLPVGKVAYVEVSNKNADGLITADAIVLKPIN